MVILNEPLRNKTVTETFTSKIWKLLKEVCDPEIPVLTVIDLGIIRNVTIELSPGNELLEVGIVITPTYSGCPAMDIISMDIRLKLIEHGYKNIKISKVLSPPWTTDWMSREGKQKLIAYGIAPPNLHQPVNATGLFAPAETVQCPLCKSYHTKLISQFGSTPCKALYQCNDCKEPFDFFKCH